jgi:hypothetical protein
VIVPDPPETPEEVASLPDVWGGSPDAYSSIDEGWQRGWLAGYEQAMKDNPL